MHNIDVKCTMEGGATYTVYIVIDNDGKGSMPTLLNPPGDDIHVPSNKKFFFYCNF